MYAQCSTLAKTAQCSPPCPRRRWPGRWCCPQTRARSGRGLHRGGGGGQATVQGSEASRGNGRPVPSAQQSLLQTQTHVYTMHRPHRPCEAALLLLSPLSRGGSLNSAEAGSASAAAAAKPSSAPATCCIGCCRGAAEAAWRVTRELCGCVASGSGPAGAVGTLSPALTGHDLHPAALGCGSGSHEGPHGGALREGGGHSRGWAAGSAVRVVGEPWMRRWLNWRAAIGGREALLLAPSRPCTAGSLPQTGAAANRGPNHSFDRP